MIVNLLQTQGIPAEVEGEFLQGGVGELQAMNLVRVMVARDDYERARSAIAEWEDAAPKPEIRPETPDRSLGAGYGFVLGLLVGMILMYLVTHS